MEGDGQQWLADSPEVKAKISIPPSHSFLGVLRNPFFPVKSTMGLEEESFYF